MSRSSMTQTAPCGCLYATRDCTACGIPHTHVEPLERPSERCPEHQHTEPVTLAALIAAHLNQQAPIP